MNTSVVHCKRDIYDVYIGHGSIWGNPFKIGQDGTRNEIIIRYEEYIRGTPRLLKRLAELQGRILGCWCAPKACHGDVLIKLLEERSKSTEKDGAV